MRIYTDGSKFEKTTTAAVWIPETGYEESWKLEGGENISIMGAEFFAISKVIEWIVLNGEFQANKQVVILTDSMSTLQTLEHWYKTKYQTAVNKIIGFSRILADMDFSLELQWVISHIGIDGNKKVDQLANGATRK